MRFLLEQFEKYREEGMAAHKAGRWAEARDNLFKAAEYLLRVAKESEGDMRARRMENAQKLLALAKSIDPTKKGRVEGRGARDEAGGTRPEGRGQRDEARGGGEEEGAEAKRWIVTKKPDVRFDDVAGLEDVKEVIRRRVIYPFQHPDITLRYKKKAGGGVLLYGPPGTGKTMIAKAIATELDATFFSVKCSDIMSKWVGEAEQNLKKLFDAARASERAVVFMDETEAIVAKRGGDSTVMNRVIPEFLAQVDGLETGGSTMLLLGATNRPWDMDEAALRTGRFGELIYIGLPDPAARLWMVRRALEGIPMADDISLEDLAQRLDGCTGADITGFVDRAKDLPYEREIVESKPSRLEKADLDATLARTRRSVNAALLAKYDKWREVR